MKKLWLIVLIVLIVFAQSRLSKAGAKIKSLSNISSIGQAKKCPIVSNRPAVDFFEGAVLGNGGLGAIVTTRPDAVVIRFGHNNVWDIRLAEKNREKIGTFQEIFEKVKAIPENVSSLDNSEWFRNYRKMCRENYAKPYPRPFPCGSIVLWFDRRETELLGHKLSIDSGVCRVDFLIDGKTVHLELFTDMQTDRLWARMVDGSGRLIKAPFKYITVLPDPQTPKELPKYTSVKKSEEAVLAFRQIMPFTEVTDKNPFVGHPKDKAFVLSVGINGAFDENATKMTRSRKKLKMGDLEGGLERDKDFVMCVQLDNGLASSVKLDSVKIPESKQKNYEAAGYKSRQIWRDYWEKSGVVLDDEILERTWYRNLYFLRCSLRPGVTCPGLFANWSYKNIGTAWHGDYHLNYNTQQPFWVTFSSNHLDLHLPYIDMVEYTLLPVSKKWAKEYYQMRGAFFPHSAYPVEMTMLPYPVPTWGWEVFETPWTVQSLWWHYRYSMDKKFLKDRGFGVIKEAVLFLVDYMKRPEAHGKGWNDNKYHIYPSVPPELYGLRPGFDKNYDTIVDLALTRFVFDAYLQSCKILDLEQKEKTLITDVRDILAHFPDYPTNKSQRGEVFVSVPGEDPEIVYNCPASLMSVFPGEIHGLDSSKEVYQLCVNTYRNQQNEGGNELVFLNLQAARLGLLDIEKFKRQIEYCLLPNGTCTDKALQIHGRYSNHSSFDFMAGMGIWFENFALPVVINECMLQSYNSRLRFFPNWPKDKKAEFRTLRAVGAFLVSAKFSDGKVEWIEVLSEAGGALTIINPWDKEVLCKTSKGQKILSGKELTMQTKPGELLQFSSRQ